MIALPDSLMKQIVMHCTENKIALAQIGNDNVTLFIMGSSNLSPDQASILAAHMLLTGVVSGGFADSNEEAKQREKDASIN